MPQVLVVHLLRKRLGGGVVLGVVAANVQRIAEVHLSAGKDKVLGERLVLREQVPMEQRLGAFGGAQRIHVVRGNDIEQHKFFHHFGMVKRHAVRNAGAAIVPHNGKAAKPQRIHNLDAILGHHAL